MNPNTKNINVKIQTYEKLLQKKEYPRESFDTAITRMLECDSNENLSEKAKSALKMLMEKQHKNKSEIINGLLECSIIEKVNKK